ncbi:MAG: hypothetical protein ACTS73_03760 [Arsenophonus sp. NEOnobi-MAG3]
MLRQHTERFCISPDVMCANHVVHNGYFYSKLYRLVLPMLRLNCLKSGGSQWQRNML